MAFGEKKGISLVCPMCDVEVPLTGDERVGESLQCPYCQTPIKLKKNKEDQLFLEEDY